MDYKTAFEYKLEILRAEIELIDKSIARIDDITTKTKNWAILLWGGSLALILQNKAAHNLIAFSAVIPLLFWVIDLRWRIALLSCTFREKKISEFLNSETFHTLFENMELGNFRILDPIGEQYKDESDFQETVNIIKALK